uniref:Putative farnesoic acid 0-methyl transferase n=1 Tax=Aedes albopictus TaxID=7160 RepID=A0A1W7R895_AEDAL
MILIVVLMQLAFAKAFNPGIYFNRFEDTNGCLQYSTSDGCITAHTFFSTSRFRHLQTTDNNVTVLRMGVLASQGPHIRLSPIEHPYDNVNMNEIVLSAWDNTASEIRRYMRHADNSISNVQVLKRISTHGLVSQFYPMMFTMKIDPNGNVKLTKDGQRVPFVEFTDYEMSYKFIGFCNYIAPATFFFDCPLKVDREECKAVALN